MTAKPEMTKLQARATMPDLTAWVGASAGTGKTHVLTARVLRLMLTGSSPGSLLCLTFTKAAAAEMKTRIFKELGTWVRLNDQDLREEVLRRTGEKLDEGGLKKARQLFAEVLELPGGLQILTFHSFCQSLLGRFPLEAALEPGFEALDETAAKSLMRRARDLMLDDSRPAGKQSLGHEGLRSALVKVATKVTEGTFDELVSELDFQRSNLSKAVNYYRSEGQMAVALWQRLNLPEGMTSDKALVTSLRNLQRAGDNMRQSGLALQQFGSAKDHERGQTLLDFTAAGDDAGAGHFRALKGIFFTQKHAPKQPSSLATKAVEKGAPGTKDKLLALQEEMMVAVDLIARAQVAEATSALMALALAQTRHYSTTKRISGKLDFDDMINHTVKLLAGDMVAPWVLFKLDTNIDHILVDEAQDTNDAQWTVIKTLAHEFFSGDVEKLRTVFAVGDAKQSIFSFQGSDPTCFTDARDEIFTGAAKIGAPAEKIPLNLSFRSGKAVLDLVDATFHKDGAACKGLTSDLEDVQHEYSRSGAGGLVEIWPLQSPGVKPSYAPWEPPLVQERGEDAAMRLADEIADHIAEMIDAKELLTARGRAILPGDIMILVQRRSDFVEFLERALKSRGVAVAGRDRMKLAEELPVMDLICLGHFVLQTGDDLALAELLKSPFISMDEESLFELAHGRSGTLYEALSARRAEPNYSEAWDFTHQILQIADYMQPFEFFSHILGKMHGRQKLAGRLGNEIADVLDAFLGEAIAFEKDNVASLQAFLAQIERSNLDIKRDLEAAGDKVRVLTVHSAKGLQAPIVYLPDSVRVDRNRDRLHQLDGGSGDAPLLVWGLSDYPIDATNNAKADKLARIEAEYRRLLYVAMTRAEDRLYVCGWETKNKTSENCWYNLIKQGFERMPEYSQLAEAKYRYEVMQSRPVLAEATVKEFGEDTLELPSWLSADLPEEPNPPRPLAPSKPLDKEILGVSPLKHSHDKIRYGRGLLIHSLLQWLPDVALSDREKRALKYLSQTGLSLSADETEQIWQEVVAILGDKNFAPLFAPGSQAEVSITGRVGDAVISGQIDRLCVSDNEILVVDYKTNRPPPSDVGKVDAAYLRQMALYRAVLSQIYPDHRIRSALLWTDTATLMALPDTSLDQYGYH